MAFDPRSRSILYSLVNASTHNLNVATSNLAVFQVTLISQSSSYTIFSCKYISTLMVRCSKFKTLQVLRSHDVEGTGNISCKRRSFAMVYHGLKSSLYIGITYNKASYN